MRKRVLGVVLIVASVVCIAVCVYVVATGIAHGGLVPAVLGLITGFCSSIIYRAVRMIRSA